MKEKELQQLLLNVINMASITQNLTGFLKATENENTKDISNILGNRILQEAPFESISQLEGVKGIGVKTIDNITKGLLANGASLNNTAKLDPQFVIDFLLPENTLTAEDSDLIEQSFLNTFNKTHIFPNEFSELVVKNTEDLADYQSSFEAMANIVRDMANAMLNDSCTTLGDRFNRIGEAASKGVTLDPIFDRISQQFYALGLPELWQGTEIFTAVDLSGLKLLLSIDNPEAQFPNISSDRLNALNQLKEETTGAIDQITTIESLLSQLDDGSSNIFLTSQVATGSSLIALNEVILQQRRCQLIESQITILAKNLLTIAALVEVLAPTFGVFFGLSDYFDNCENEGLLSCDLVGFDAYAVVRIGGRIAPATENSGRLVFGTGPIDSAIGSLIATVEAVLTKGEIPEGLKNEIKALLQGKELSALIASFIAGKIGMKFITGFIQTRLVALFTRTGLSIVGGAAALAVIFLGFAVTIAHLAIEAFTKDIQGVVLFCATFNVTACVKNFLGIKRKTTYTIDLKIRPKDIYGVIEGTIRDLVFLPNELGVPASDMLELAGYINYLNELNKKLKATKSKTEQASIKLQITGIEAAIKKLAQANKNYNQIKKLAITKAKKAIKASTTLLPMVNGFESCR
ncbi:MAG: hypothetical protein AAFP76_12990 [Bacteroidota bacterium]